MRNGMAPRKIVTIPELVSPPRFPTFLSTSKFEGPFCQLPCEEGGNSAQRDPSKWLPRISTHNVPQTFTIMATDTEPVQAYHLDKPLKVQCHDCSSILIGVPFGGTMSKVSHAETSMATSDIGLPAPSLTTSEAEPAPFKKSRLRDKSDQTQALPALKHCMPASHWFYLAFHWGKEDCTSHVFQTCGPKQKASEASFCEQACPQQIKHTLRRRSLAGNGATAELLGWKVPTRCKLASVNSILRGAYARSSAKNWLRAVAGCSNMPTRSLYICPFNITLLRGSCLQLAQKARFSPTT